MIAKHLWDNNTLYQSEALIEIYKNKLISLSMLEHAENATEDGNGATGGMSIAETHKHFAERFLASSSRVEFICINPRGDFNLVSNDIQTTFSSGRISILDIPAGTGASILSLLCNIAELRRSSLLPRLPLYINIMGGDFSNSALSIYVEILDDIKVHLEKQLIFIQYKTFNWDASSSPSTNLLLKEWLKDEEEYEEFYVLMSAFSGVGSTIYKNFEESFIFTQTYISHLPATTLFVEPITRSSRDFFKLIGTWMTKAIDWLQGQEESTGSENRYKWYDPVRKNIAKSAVSVKLYGRR